MVVSPQHADGVESDQIHEDIQRNVIDAVIPAGMMDEGTAHYINPSGRFVVGGPKGDAGLTGRKIIVDTYGGVARHGGGAFSGKDPSKVDRSASYMARYIAKNIVAAELADVCEVQLSYAIGVAEPTSVLVDCQGTETVALEAIEAAVRETFPLTPGGIIETLGLRAPIYTPTAAHGHFGRSPDEGAAGAFSWERTDRVDALKQATTCDAASC